MKLKFNGFLALLLVLMAQLTFAQERAVSGIVSDNAGMPIPGVNVLVKGSKAGTQTDFDGRFNIKASPTSTLVFTFLGMKSQEVVASSTSLIVKMQSEAKELSEVVVTAMGIKKSEKAVGYAAQSIKGSSLTEARESNLVNALSGKIAGVQVTNSSGAVGASSRVVLRGASSITGNNQAMFVVDGIPFDNSSGASGTRGIALGSQAGSGGGRDLPNGVASINPDDIESITVLKGPTAAALYGMRAGQGVIVITTKKGKEGGKELGISFNTNTTFSNPLVLPKFQNSYGQSGRTADNFFQYTDGSAGTTADGTDESWGMPLDRGLSFVQWDSFKYGGAPTPWVSHPNNVKDFYKTGIATSNSLSLNGGGENANFRFSVGNSDEKGMIPFTDFKKFNVSGSGNLKLGKNVTAGMSVNYFNDFSNNLPTVGYTGENVVQQFIWSARNVNFSDLKDWRNLPLATSGAAKGTPANWNTQFQNNPYWVLENNVNTYNRDRINGKINLAYKFAKGFTITGDVAVDHYNQTETTQQAFGSAQNQFGNGTAPYGSYSNLAKTFNEINASLLLSYTTKLTEDIGFNINAGSNKMKRVKTFLYGRAEALELNNVYNLSNLKSGTTAKYLNDYNEFRINSVYAFGQLSYKTWLFLDITGRNDWASVLPKANNSFFYPSVTGSIVLSDILDTKSAKIDYLKVRAGWSKVGGTGALGAYNLNDTFTLTPGSYGNLGQVPNTEFNNKLKPESVTGTEVGLDLKALDNRVRFSATYYDQTSKDLLLPVDPSAASGFLASWQNAATMNNKGIELQLGLTAVKSQDFSFDIDLNFAKNKNTVVSLGGLDSYELGSQWGISLQARTGMPYGVLVGRDFERDATGAVIYENGLPKIDSNLKPIGNIAPDWTGGANFTLRYKNFDLSTLIDAKIGGDIHSMTYAWGRYAGTLEESLIGREGGVTGSGVMDNGSGVMVPNNVVVSAKAFNQTAYGNDVESSAIFDASYVKLRQVSFGYTFSRNFLRGTFIDGIKLSVVGRNLALLYKAAPHIDPESAFSSTNGEQGQEFGQLPSARSMGFNLNVKF